MPSIINSDDGVVSGTSGLKTTGGNDGLLNLQTNGSTAMSINASQQVTFNNGANLPNTFGFKNRIINGACVIDQRNAGASVTLNNTASYTLDRWYDRCVGGAGSAVMTVQRSTTAPAGFINSKLTTVTTSKSPAVSEQFWFYQAVEGLNMADFGMGTASAVTFTLSFWVRASVTGTYSVAFQNSAQNRSYVATYTVNAANTFEYKTVTITGDTTGTWLTDNGVGMYVFFDTGSGSNFNATAGAWTAGTYYRTSGSVSLIANSGATFYITGVQLERGSAATSFDFRSYGTELHLCQRYFYNLTNCAASAASTTKIEFQYQHPVPMRGTPSLNVVGVMRIEDPSVAAYSQSSATSTLEQPTYLGMKPGFGNFTGLTVARPYYVAASAANVTASPPTGLCQVSAEL
jgi:hypothetical protein